MSTRSLPTFACVPRRASKHADLRKTWDHSEISFFSLSWSTCHACSQQEIEVSYPHALNPNHCCNRRFNIQSAHAPSIHAVAKCPGVNSENDRFAKRCNKSMSPACSISLATQTSERHRSTDPAEASIKSDASKLAIEWASPQPLVDLAQIEETWVLRRQGSLEGSHVFSLGPPAAGPGLRPRSAPCSLPAPAAGP